MAALAGSGLGYSALDSKSNESSSSRVAGDRPGQVAGQEGVDHRAELRPDPVGGRR